MGRGVIRKRDWREDKIDHKDRTVGVGAWSLQGFLFLGNNNEENMSDVFKSYLKLVKWK